MGFTGLGDPLQITRIEVMELAYNNVQAGEAVNAYQVVFLDGAFWLRADASNSARARPPIAIAQDTVTSGQLMDAWMKAIVSNGAWSLASGLRCFLGSGPGNIVTSAPTASGNISLLLGWAVTPQTLEFSPAQPVTIAA
mgnify:CR=1 FL=1